ncbi:MAG TPA: YHS domain-containing protein [Candidatus Limnocylindrales bacterium]
MATVVDPVCGMQVDTESASSAEHEGTRYYFCGDACRQQFAVDPDRYAKP